MPLRSIYDEDFTVLILVKYGYFRDYLDFIHSSLHTIQGPSCRGTITIVSAWYYDGVDLSRKSSIEGFPCLKMHNKYQYTIGITILMSVMYVISHHYSDASGISYSILNCVLMPCILVYTNPKLLRIDIGLIFNRRNALSRNTI